MQLIILLFIIIFCLYFMGRLVYGKKKNKTFSFLKVLANFILMMFSSGLISLVLLLCCSFILGMVIATIPGIEKVVDTSKIAYFEMVKDTSDELGNSGSEQSGITEAKKDDQSTTTSTDKISDTNKLSLGEATGTSTQTSIEKQNQTLETTGKFSTVKLLLFILAFIFVVAILLVIIRRKLLRRFACLRLSEEEYEISEYFIQWMTIYVVVYQLLFDTLKSLDKLLPEMKNWQSAFEVILSPENINAISQPLLIATWIAIVIEKLYYRNNKEN